MKKMLMLSATAALFLAACNDTTKEVAVDPTPVEEATTEATQAVEQATEQQEAEASASPTQPSTTVEPEATEQANPIEEADSETVDSVVEQTEEEAIIEEADSETVEGSPATEVTPSSEITYMQNGNVQTAPTNFLTSAEQPFGLEVMNGFTLVAEEPGKDQLIYDADARITMAIETYTLGEITYDELFNSALEEAGTLGEASPIEELPYHDNIANIAAFDVTIDNEKVVVMAIETPSTLAKFTIYDTLETDLTQAMIQMAATIKGQ